MSATRISRPNGAFCRICRSQSLLSDTLGPVRLRLTAAAIRTIEKNGGLDAYLRGMPDSRLSPEIRRLKKRILTAVARRAGKSFRPNSSPPSARLPPPGPLLIPRCRSRAAR